MAKQVDLNKKKGKGNGQGENRPVWNNVQRLNHQNKFVPTAILTRTGRIPVNIASHNFNRQAVSTSAARKVNAIIPIVNENRPRNNLNKSHLPIRRPFNRTTTPRTNLSNQKVNTAEVKAVSAIGGKRETVVKPSEDCNWRPKRHDWNKFSKYNDNPQRDLKNKGIVDSGCSRHMTGNKAYLAKYQDYNGGPVAFRGSKGYITDTECLVLSSNFKLPDENQVLLRIHRQNNMYSFNIENIVPSRGLACLIAKATINESNKCHRRLGHVNFKNLNKLVKGNLVRGLPSMIFQNDHTCVACQKGKQHKASCKAKSASSISKPLQLLHMDLFGPISVRSINHKTYFLVITDDSSRFSWVFFLRTKDETSRILKDFIRQIKNQLNQKVKTIRCDNGTKFKNRDIIELCGSKGIKREYSNARTPQQNGVAKRKNRTLIKAARTMLADSFLPNTLWAKAVSTACYVLNRVLVTKPQNKTPYELITSKIPIISYIRPFGCHMTILNTIDHLGKFEGKSDEGFLVGYSLNSKAFRVYNLETKRVEENLHITFLENKPNVVGKGPNWLFDLDYLTDSINYQPMRSENQANKTAGPKEANHSAEILKKFDFTCVKTASTPIETQKPLTKDEEADDVDIYIYRSMTGSLMYLNASRPDIMYLKGKPKLGLWYPRVSSFDLEAYLDSDYAGANLDRKSITGGCQFLSRRLISWQFKKQTIVATSTTEAEYVAVANYCGDAYEKKLIQVLKINTDDNVVDLLTKAFNVSRGSLEDTNRSEGTQVQLSHDSPLSGDHTSEKAKGGLNIKELFVVCTNLSNRVLALETSKDTQVAEILKLKDQIKKLKRKCKPSISYYKAWLKRVKRLSMKKRLEKKESGLHGNRGCCKRMEECNENEELNKGSGEKGGSTEELVSTDVPKTVSTARPELSTARSDVDTARPDVDAARQEDSADEPRTPPPTTSIFDDEDITMAQTLIKMKE
ncbi:putative ribonuclease H-like domain-containing protein [Tanacetum coccineum]